MKSAKQRVAGRHTVGGNGDGCGPDVAPATAGETRSAVRNPTG